MSADDICISNKTSNNFCVILQDFEIIYQTLDNSKGTDYSAIFRRLSSDKNNVFHFSSSPHINNTQLGVIKPIIQDINSTELGIISRA